MLDDFDMFAAKARQTVLYNLLDCMQAPDIQARRVSCRGSFAGPCMRGHANTRQASETGLPRAEDARVRAVPL